MFPPKLHCVLASGLLAIPLVLFGCQEEGAEIADGDVGDVGDGDGDGDTAESGNEEGTDEGDTDEPLEQRPALGISITRVEINQGTAIFVAEGGEWVPPEGRLGPIVKNRDTLVRVHYRVDEGFVPRELEARLILQLADGTESVHVQPRTVEGDSAPNTLGGTFYFGLVGEEGEVAPGTNFKVELHEVEDDPGGGMSEGVWQAPAELSPLGVQPELLELKVVFVPYHHLYENIDRVADTNEATMKVITDELYQQQAITDLIWEVHEPVVWDAPMDNLGAVLGPLAALRDNELAFPNVYYHALFPVPNGGVAGVAGVAQVPGPGKGEGDQRVSVSALGNSVNGTAGTVVHEVGHNSGMAHVYCPFAMAASPDPAYPYQNGLIGEWGFGIIDFTLHSPENTYDYMSYCGPSWLSRWSWYKSFSRARTLTAWDYEDQSGPDLHPYVEHDLLIGSLNANGSEFWWTSHGSLPGDADPYGAEYPHHVELYSQGELVAALPGVIRYTNDYSTAWLISELPPELAKLEGIDEIVRVDDLDEPHVVGVEAVQISTR